MKRRFPAIFGTAWAAIEKRGLPGYVWQSDPLTFWRERILFLVCFVSASLGLFALVPSVCLAFMEKLWGVICLDMLAYSVALGVLVGRRLPLAFRALAVCSIFYLLGTGLLFMVGPLSAGYIWLFGASVLVSAIIGMQAALLTLALNAFTLAAVGIWIFYAVPAWASYAKNPLEIWGVISVNFLILNALVTITTAFMLNGLKDALFSEQQTSASLRQSEERFRSLFEDISGIAVQGYDPERRVVYWNRASSSLYGYARKEALGRRMEELIVPKSRQARMAERFRRWVEQGHSMPNEELILENKSGMSVPVYSSRVMHTDLRGEQVIFCIDLPLSALHRAEAERDRLMLAIEQAGEMIIVLDGQGRFQYVNPAFTKVTGYSTGDVVGRSIEMLAGDAPDGPVYAEMCETVRKGRSWRGTLNHLKMDGTPYIQESSITPILDAKGEIASFIGVNRDVTEQVRIHQEKAELEDQYRQSQKVEAVGRLAGGVAHDLNNMLSPILGYGEMLQLDLPNHDARREYIDEILKAAARARDLVRQLLAFSRKQALEYKVIDLNGVIENIEKLLRRTIREDINIEMRLDSQAPHVRADTGQIEQVILNLCVNAQDAMPEGGRILIETDSAFLDHAYAATHAGVKTGAYARMTVTDTGCGMSPETAEKIFEPFFSTKGREGTGLGLATVYGVVKQHGGNVWVYSEPGKGSVFKVYLPATDETRSDQPETHPAPLSRLGSETILIAEDQEQVRDLAVTFLKQQGYTILAAANGSQAREILQQHSGPVHLLVTDVVMPEINGRELFSIASRIHPELKVLYMSGYTDNAIVHQGVLEKGIAFLQKPFTLRDLAGKVRAVLDAEK